MRGGRALTVLAGLAILVAACGTQSTQNTAVAAAAATTAGESAKLTLTTTILTRGLTALSAETGRFAFARSYGILRTQGPSNIASEELFVGPRVYENLPVGTQDPLPGKSWVGLTAAASAALTSTPRGLLADTNPADMLSALKGMSSATRLGTATVHGVTVTRYRVKVDPATTASALPRWERASYQTYARNLGSAADVQIWVDHHNLIRQLVISYSLSGGPVAGSRVTQTLELSDFGMRVQGTAPPAANVATASQLARADSSGANVPGVTDSPPPPASGTLPPGRAAGAEKEVRAFWSALKSNNLGAVARTVVPAQDGCFRYMKAVGPSRFAVASLRIISAEAAGRASAIVTFTLKVQALQVAGQSTPLFSGKPSQAQWLTVSRANGRWYVNLARSTSILLSPMC